MQQLRVAGIELEGETNASFPAGVAVRKGNEALLRDVNRAIAAIASDGTLRRIEQRWRPAQIVLASRSTVQRVAIWGALLFVLLVGGGATLWVRTLRREVRERRRAEEALSESHQQLTLALVGANMATWRWSAATGLWTRDGGLNRMMGRGSEPTTQTIDEVLQALHPDDRDRLRLAFMHAVDTCGTYQQEYRVLMPDGVRTMRSRGRVFPGANGQAEYATGLVVDITAEVDAARKDQLLTHALRTASDGIIITDPGGTIVYANPSFLRTYEYEEPEILGQHVRVLRAEGDRFLFAPIDTNSWRGEVMNRAKSGRVFPVSLATSVVRDARGDIVAVVGVFRDITRERQAHDALRASEAKFSRAFEASPDAITITDLEGRGILMVNEAFERISGYSRDEVLGRTAADVGLFVDPGLRDSIVERVLSEGSMRDVEMRVRRKDGSIRTMLISSARLEVDGRTCMLNLGHDISDRKRFELQMRQATEANRLLLCEMDVAGLAAATVEAVHTLLPLNLAALVVGESTANLAVVAQRGVLDTDRARRVSVAAAARALAPPQPLQLFADDALRTLDDGLSDLPAMGVAALCSLPLTTSRGALGALVVGSGSPGGFGGDELSVLQQMSGFVAIAIQNAQAFDEIRTLKDRLSSEKLYLEEEIVSITTSRRSSARAPQSSASSSRSRRWHRRTRRC
ncbi:MAG: PAS domain S-box protein [Vicinamibacterales bacterium]